MGTRNPSVDAYIAKAGDFAQPILRYLRDLVHEACPDVEEVMKWSFPNFTYKGMYCNMASFKEHCSFGFWKSSLLPGPSDRNGMGHFGRITEMKDLPPKREILNLLKEAKRLNDEGVAKPKPKVSKEKKELKVPDYFLAAVKKNKKALSTFESFSYSHKKEYVEWVTEAKSEATRDRRLAQTVEWLAEGKSRNWKYERC
jgi:hypothetical protein